MRRRVGDVGAAAEDGDRPARVDGAAVGAGVDAEGEAADHDQPRRRQLAAEVAGDLAPVGGGPARADDRHRAERLEAVEQARVAAADQRPGRVVGVAQADRVEVAVPAAGPASAPPASSPSARPRRAPRPGPASGRRPSAPSPRPGPRSRAAAVPASASRPPRSRCSRCRGRARRGARSGAGSRRRRSAQSRSRLRSCSACAICSTPIVSSPARSATVRASRSARSWARPLSRCRA